MSSSNNISNQKNTFGGYEHKIFVKPINMDLVCAICSCKIILNIFFNFSILNIFITIIIFYSRRKKTKRMYSLRIIIL